jgi:tetratricopeptide (TPR) repeat protein
MADILRLQNKPVASFKRYLDAAKAKAGDLARDIALSEALVLARDGKLDDAKAAFSAIDQGDNALEKSGDVRARLHLALIALAQNRPQDSKTLVDQVMAAQPNHAAGKALATKLETLVAKTDPLPPEDGKGSGSGAGSSKPPGPGPGPDVSVGPGDSYDKILGAANKVADTNCTKAIALFQKALEVKPNGVEALTGLGYCYVDAKQFKSAHDKFHLALVVSPRYEPALSGIAEAYQQQGLRDKAIEAWKAYQEVYPNAKAKRQLEMLGVTDNGGGGSAAPPPTPPTPPPTPPTPPPDQGSGSG